MRLSAAQQSHLMQFSKDDAAMVSCHSCLFVNDAGCHRLVVLHNKAVDVLL